MKRGLRIADADDALARSGQFGREMGLLRKGLKGMEDEGKIIRHVGRGPFVADARPAQPTSDAQNLLNRVVGTSAAE